MINKFTNGNHLDKFFSGNNAMLKTTIQNEDLSVFRKTLTAIESHEQNKYAEDGQVKVALHYRNNPDGTPRWIWPEGMSKPVFLKFYSASTLKAKTLSFIIRFLFAFKLQRVFASGKMQVIFNLGEYTEFLSKGGKDWSLFTGTAGLNRTALFYGNDCFYKIAVGENANDLLAHEFNNIDHWKSFRFSAMELPVASINSGVLKQTDIAGAGKRIPILTSIHWKALWELSELKNCKTPVAALPAWKMMEEKLAALLHSHDTRLPKGFVKKLAQLKDTINSSGLISATYSHGDFTPWNLFVKDNTLAVIDWELAHNSMPALFDAFHFMYQQASLVDHCSYKELTATIDTAFKNPVAQSMIRANDVDVNLHHQLYLLFTAVYYLDIYSKQNIWHLQVNMSLNCWNDALNEQLQKTGEISRRQLLLTDIFDFLREKEYAALKWLSAGPADLSEESDIDICVTKTVRNELRIFLENHPYTNKLKEKRKSFMSTFSVVLTDDSFISIDSILTFKRRNMVMLDAKELLASAAANAYGVKIPSVENDFNYMWLFYLLNNAAVPERYQQHYNFFSPAWRKQLNETFTWKEQLAVRNYSEVYNYNPGFKKIVSAELMKMDVNKGFSKLKNKLNYFIDTLKESFFERGFVITFSGVDGAGKSTIIENVKQQIEKKYRRKVVVLRHRPSLLPMISGLKEGRKASEQRSASTLPRQGNNSSVLSSLIRFAYYYSDYLFGQFVIYVKYVLRGYVVLYDRYYFDFINDGKRSNIVLPPAFTKLWYVFLLKPKFNFFLYADADTILKRKKEMDKNTISLLTGKYLQLFTQLGDRYSQSKYISIQNDVLSQTMKTILYHVKQKAL